MLSGWWEQAGDVAIVPHRSGLFPSHKVLHDVESLAEVESSHDSLSPSKVLVWQHCDSRERKSSLNIDQATLVL